jgi:hypothetical protein
MMYMYGLLHACMQMQPSRSPTSDDMHMHAARAFAKSNLLSRDSRREGEEARVFSSLLPWIHRRSSRSAHRSARCVQGVQRCHQLDPWRPLPRSSLARPRRARGSRGARRRGPCPLRALYGWARTGAGRAGFGSSY